MEDRRHYTEEEIVRQVQSAVAPFTALAHGLNKKLDSITVELAEIRKENQEFKDLINGAKFLAGALKVLLLCGGVIAMFWGAFVVIKHG